MWVGMGRTRGAYNLLCPFEINLICLKLSFGTIEGPSRSALSGAPGRLWGKKGLNSIKPTENGDGWAPRSMESAIFVFYVVWAFKQQFCMFATSNRKTWKQGKNLSATTRSSVATATSSHKSEINWLWSQGLVHTALITQVIQVIQTILHRPDNSDMMTLSISSASDQMTLCE